VDSDRDAELSISISKRSISNVIGSIRQNGAPIGALEMCWLPLDPRLHGFVSNVNSDSSSRFRISLPFGGRYEVIVPLGNSEVWQGAFDFEAGVDSKLDINIECGGIAGQIVDSHGLSCTGAPVYLFRERPRFVSDVAVLESVDKSDELGSFARAPLATGQARVVVWKNNENGALDEFAVSEPFEIRVGATTAIPTIRLEPRIRVRFDVVTPVAVHASGRLEWDPRELFNPEDAYRCEPIASYRGDRLWARPGSTVHLRFKPDDGDWSAPIAVAIPTKGRDDGEAVTVQVDAR
jgi:hypothetical protein